MRRFFFIFLLLISCFLAFSCFRKVTFTEFISSPFEKPKQHTEIAQIYIVIDEEMEIDSALFTPIYTEFGSIAEGGLVSIVESITTIEDIEPNSIIVSINGPVKTARDLGRLRSSFSDILIVSLFPMDEPLAIEAVSDLIVDYAIESDLLAAETSVSDQNLSNAEKSSIILASVLSAEQLILSKNEPSMNMLELFTASIEAVREIQRDRLIGSNWIVSFYIDSQTTLRAWNHLILTQSKTERLQ